MDAVSKAVQGGEGVRLIDADALKEATEAHDEKIAYVVSFLWDVDAAPTIDAIPVDWVRGYTAVGVAPTGDRLTEGKERLIVHRILNEWQKEQEAR